MDVPFRMNFGGCIFPFVCAMDFTPRFLFVFTSFKLNIMEFCLRNRIMQRRKENPALERGTDIQPLEFQITETKQSNIVFPPK